MRIVPGLLSGLLLLAVGTRLSILAWRNRRLPEGLLAAFFVCVAFAAPLVLEGMARTLDGDPDGWMLTGLGQGLLSVGMVSLSVFTWRTFGPDSPVRGWAALLAAAGSAASFVVLAQTGFSPRAHDAGALATLPRVAMVLWLFVESLRYHALMRRRLALGLADPVVTNRFLLTNLWSGTLCFVICTAMAIRVVLPLVADPANPPVWILGPVRALLASGMLVATVCLWLSFFPPARYVRRLVASAPPPGA